nr:hypothetical protein B0A51_14534 [Rachicladosporium sp. CCFEE 5018]OQO25551.1 hypothetical protein B0A51_06870 [Rachicladosporium sp. CCFEE 5018]
MPFPFADICTLLTRLENIDAHGPLHLPGARKAKVKEVTESWFKSHQSAIAKLDVNGAAALLSALLPERRTDRVYGIQASGLCRILCRGLHLQAGRVKDLRAYAQPGHGDLGLCLERVLRHGDGPPAHPIVTLEEVDDFLITLAGGCRFSDPNIQQVPAGSSEARDQLLARLVLRLEPVHAKWLVRLVMKDLSPVKVDEGLVLRSFHFLLPDLLRFQHNFNSAISLLRGPLVEYPERPDPRSQRLLRQQATSLIRPCVGVKVGRPNFHKARSMQHCINLLGQQQWVLERKYDGEYCEIHIDMSLSRDPTRCIKIFSKSGKDSTADRKGIHGTLVKCLGLGQAHCKIKRQAILLGELVVWADSEKRAMTFEKIRKHVTRSGVSLGTNLDSQKHEDEHLAIVFFDLLLLDGEVVMTKPIDERRSWLREVYKKIKGRAFSAEWKKVDFSKAEPAQRHLLHQFAASIAERCEGLVLKPCGVPYFSLNRDDEGFTGGFVKLKKDYIADLGDEADFAVIGATYNAQHALKSGLQQIKWSDFHLGALLNKADVLRYEAKPKFKIIGTVNSDGWIPKPVLQSANTVAEFCAIEYGPQTSASHFDLETPPSCKIDHIFTNPLVFEVLGSGFEKPSNADYLMLRHARVKKLHQDRSWKDCVSFRELQDQAQATRDAPADSESQETRRWIEKLERKCRKKFEREKNATPRSRTTGTPSTSRSVCTAKSVISVTKATAKVLGEQPARRPMSDVSGNRQQALVLVAADIAEEAPDGSTLVAQSPSPDKKRRHEDARHTPCPPAKRPCSSPKIRRSVHSRETSAGPALTYAPKESATQMKTAEATQTSILAALPGRLSSLFRQPVQDVATQAQPSAGHGPTNCETASCHFSEAVVYLAPCIAKTPYITSTLLSQHSAILTCAPSHWARQIHAHASLTDTVSESQSYPGCRKIVLVEARRVDAMHEVVLDIEALGLKERVEVWDWRVLERMERHGKLDEHCWWAHFVGALIWDGESDGAEFVWSKRGG